ncbi:helix-turn-helix domain-containing protein [Sulfolobus acidocaldarius]|uniref:Conserved Archaeal HTH-domain protein n=4 Tax=Sulfolobus acidocaldarius TaxID=2285 RepID=Q4J6E2_SULAC|nr:helix-turn-helix domain-containing protein [Sulfolobus acidocaldarius]AAY81639.1 conserved Archaeal HTH-domain protein [Sulfolobus acidocaldarius DSM 639]AGE72242.1 transcriptional regulator, XRE family [Sulfolobus acidocaldarius N8]AGE74559.1 transcriptional regulator, XRE family [Sulfolobus acidocaldarius Ron12/I]ALU29595.1 XRE family transcriptional regulator [Sulfolobus acidocaldarius]ALU32327.1 XRE family transcriptional regulator [Sulfolobus acidocaldarius]
MDYIIESLAKRIVGDIGFSDNPGSSMRKWRDIFHVSQGELARYLGISQSVIADYEKGRRKPGVEFVKRFVLALVNIDIERGYNVINELIKGYTLMLPFIDDLGDYNSPVSIDDIVMAVDGILPNSSIPETSVFGWLITDSIKAITSLKGLEFYQLLNFMIGRVVIFTSVSTGRSPMIALKIAPIKPSIVVFHRPVRIDPLSLMLAERDNITIIISTLKNVEDLKERIRRLNK